MKIMNKDILPAIGISLMICLVGSLIYFNVFELLNKLVQTPLGYAYLSIIFVIIGIVIPFRIRRAVYQGDERLLIIHNESSSATLYWVLGFLFVGQFFLQSRSLQTMQVALSPLILVAITLIGGAYCIAFAYYYLKMS